jgi:hypothetical protein
MTRRRPAPVDLPGEPLVVDGTKYRIREVLVSSTPERPAIVRARTSYGGAELEATVDEYDPVPGVCRGTQVAGWSRA